MHGTNEVRKVRGPWWARGRAVMVAAALVLAALPATTAAAGGHRGSTLVVRQGESIQAAVDRARSGDTIKIQAGTYQEAVCVHRKGLTVVGAGAGRTTISWPEWNRVSDLPAVPSTPCWTAQEAADAEGDPTTLADDVSGLFFLDPDRPVTVTGLTTKNHPANGIATWRARGFDVHDTASIGHERYGVLAAASRHISITGNRERGVVRAAPVLGGTAGISIGDSDRAGAVIRANRVEGFNLGVFFRESRGGEIVGNTVTGNCVGILVFDDSATEVPDTRGSVEGGDVTIHKNSSVANNRYCIAGRNGSQLVSGVGVSVTNADSVRITRNTITGNRPVVPSGAAPINYPAGGLSLVSFSPPPGTSPAGAPDPGLVSHVKVTGNTFADNAPVDIWVTRPIPNTLLRGTGPGVVIQGNRCTTSDPAGYCGR
ncbi:right-handed parallel beta-helix repeat-containing protein [Modestobacter sp. VKM Ac-2986]|uniref:right-handed parallel beta-helix repeat-containing protein n=1 Tax=Modestobacter sp. VKM Ac-2986 TaxID=3004140 RepID=UPI0022AAC07F|nr:right-handed parallel beta-helix repeat-containing protein [Modestobacter sp. VKM Ac-2986]MCZ2827235.1 right-handed parallel beta-helix repeat-containing protein [Modestobacter sp. VKM Ac-2986]